jgi:hypothetical protein
VRLGHARLVFRPALGQIKLAIDEGVAARRDIAGENADLAVRDLACRPVYCRATPQDAFPCFKNPVSSTTRTASSSARISSA